MIIDRVKSMPAMSSMLQNSYTHCGQVMKAHSRSFYLGTLAMPPQKRRAIWAIYAWCRYVDDIVDSGATIAWIDEQLGKVEANLIQAFQGQPTTLADVALVDTIQAFALEMLPFKDMIKGQRMDLEKNRYETFEDLEVYCYGVAGTVGLMALNVLNYTKKARTQTENLEQIKGALALGTANQLTNIIRDVAEDLTRNRIYLPLEDLRAFDYTEAELFQGVMDERWRALMRFQVERAHNYYQQAHDRLPLLSRDSQRAVKIALSLYRSLLDRVKHENYDVFSQRLSVPQLQKIGCVVASHLNFKIPSFLGSPFLKSLR